MEYTVFRMDGKTDRFVGDSFVFPALLIHLFFNFSSYIFEVIEWLTRQMEEIHIVCKKNVLLISNALLHNCRKFLLERKTIQTQLWKNRTQARENTQARKNVDPKWTLDTNIIIFPRIKPYHVHANTQILCQLIKGF